MKGFLTARFHKIAKDVHYRSPLWHRSMAATINVSIKRSLWVMGNAKRSLTDMSTACAAEQRVCHEHTGSQGPGHVS